MTAAVSTALARLGYAPLWLEEGILGPALLAQQCAALDVPEADPNTEHYRAAALRAFLAARATLSDREVAAVLTLGRLDPDASLRPNFPHSLMRFRGLTDAQFEQVAVSYDDDGFRRIVARHRWLRALDRAQVSEQQLEDAVRDGDAHVHEAVLGRADLTRRIVELLSHAGANRAVKHRAAQLLRGDRFRSV